MAAQSHHFVYLSSASAHTISGFEISPSSGAVTQVSGSPFSEGHEPGGLAFHPSGRFLYAVNSIDNNVSAFSVDAVSGALTELSASPFAVGAGATPRFVAVEPSGKFLYVVGTLPDLQGTATLVSYYSIDAAGVLNSVAEGTSPAVLLSPIGIAFKPGDRFLYIVGTASSNGVSIFTLELDPLTGTLSNGGVSTGLGQFAKAVALAPGGQFLFVARGQSQGLIDTYALPADVNFGQPLSTFSVPGASGAPFALASDISGSYLYAAVANLGLIGFSVDSGSGALNALPGGAFVGPPISPSAVMAADPVAQFPNVYYEQRVFSISASGALGELAALPLAVAGSVTGIAAASPVDQLPTDPINPISGPVILLSPSSLQFSEQTVGGSSLSRSISLTNTGSAPLVLSGISLTGLNAADFGLSYDCPAVVNPGSDCTITITFQPQFQGAREASLSIVDNAPDSPHTVALAGTAQLPFTFQPDRSTSTVTAGQMAEYSLTLVPAPGFIGRVVLACTGAPDQATCDVPAPLDMDGITPLSFSVTVHTKARSTVAPLARPAHPTLSYADFVSMAAVGAALALLVLLLSHPKTELVARPASGIRRTAAAFLLSISLIFVSCAAPTGAGTSGSAGAPTNGTPAIGTPAGQYWLTLTATSGTVTESIQLSLSVQ